MMHNVVIVYLHGFLSSPQAHKAQLIQQYILINQLNVDCLVPSLADKPSVAIPQLKQYFETLTQKYDKIIIVGSSLGGFYAHNMAEQFNLSCVLINPVVDAFARMVHYDEQHVGQLENPYTQQVFSISTADSIAIKNLELERHVDSLNSLENRQGMNKVSKLVLLQMADEVLDARLAAQYYTSSCCLIDPKGDHQYQAFETKIPIIFAWCGL